MKNLDLSTVLAYTIPEKHIAVITMWFIKYSLVFYKTRIMTTLILNNVAIYIRYTTKDQLPIYEDNTQKVTSLVFYALLNQTILPIQSPESRKKILREKYKRCIRLYIKSVLKIHFEDVHSLYNKWDFWQQQRKVKQNRLKSK